MEPPVLLYDTTLRDGTQGENINFSAEDKVRIALRLDDIGIHYIEGGWPGSNPRDRRFFELARDLQLKNARLAAFGSTRRPGVTPAEDANVSALLESNTPVVTIFGKTWDLHVEHVMDNTLEENLAMIRDTVQYLKQNDREVIYDAEHFFDGYRNNPDYARETLRAALEGGADAIVLCDTNGGSLPFDVETATKEVQRLLEGNDAALEAAKPGNTCEEVEAAWRKVIQRYGIEKETRCGYSIGLSYPPDWGERTMSIRQGDKTVLEESMTFHLIPAIWEDDWGLEITESFRVTEGGAETFCNYPRRLFIKD